MRMEMPGSGGFGDSAVFRRPLDSGCSRRQGALERLLLAGVDDAAIGLAAQLAGERERLAAAEARLGEQARELSRLRVDLEALRGQLPAAPRPASAPTGRLVELPPPGAASGPEYWLCRCAGFRVDAEGVLVGKVSGIRFDSRHDCPARLEVRTRRPRRLVLVPVEDVEQIDPVARRIVLRVDPRRHTVRMERGMNLHGLVSRLSQYVRAA
jgi:hypothetical protein